MKALITVLALGIFLLLETNALACKGCSVKSNSVQNNVQSSNGIQNNPQGLAGAKIARGITGTEKTFKDDKVFESVGKDQGTVDPNWSSAIGE